MELVAEGLGGGEELRPAGGPGIGGKDRGAGEAEQMVFLEILHDGRVHISELTAVALVEDDDHMLLIDLVGRVFFDESGQLLDGGDDDMGVVVLQLLFQDGGGGVAVGGSLFKAVIFLHGLVVQILPVHHEQHLVDVG